jgi:hypothetical protein
MTTNHTSADLKKASHRSLVTSRQLPVTSHRSPVTGHRSPVTNYELELRFTSHESRFTNHEAPFAGTQDKRVTLRRHSGQTNHEHPSQSLRASDSPFAVAQGKPVTLRRLRPNFSTTRQAKSARHPVPAECKALLGETLTPVVCLLRVSLLSLQRFP